MKIIFTGDMFLGGDLNKQIVENIIKLPQFRNADIRIANLEQAISNSSYIADKGTLYTSAFAVEQLKQLKIDFVNLANNHIHDKGADGIIETIEHLEKAGIKYFGAGRNIKECNPVQQIAQNLTIFGYCEFNKPYLQNVQVAGEDTPGVKPLTYESISEDLNKLSGNQQAILYFHWGREHVSLPSAENIELAKKLLKDKRVFAIIGMHPHRIQANLQQNGKYVFFSLGNFLFPNFFIKPPIQIIDNQEINTKYRTTRYYHKVSQITYKKWKRINRISLILELDTNTGKFRQIPVIQQDNKAVIKPVSQITKALIFTKIFILKNIYKLPKAIYKPLEKINSKLVFLLWYWHIFLFNIKDIGLKESIKKVLKNIKNG